MYLNENRIVSTCASNYSRKDISTMVNNKHFDDISNDVELINNYSIVVKMDFKIIIDNVTPITNKGTFKIIIARLHFF